MERQLIIVSGPQGSGKSTLIRKILAWRGLGYNQVIESEQMPKIIDESIKAIVVKNILCVPQFWVQKIDMVQTRLVELFPDIIVETQDESFTLSGFYHIRLTK